MSPKARLHNKSPACLLVSAFDPLTGAGTHADFITARSLGTKPVALLTGVTAQNSRGVTRVKPVSADLINEQWQVLSEDIPVKANELMTELRERLAKKAFENANVYYKIQNFRAATKAFEVMIQEFPDSRYREQAQYLWFKSAADLADNSIFSKKKNRYLDALDLYERFVDKYPASPYLKEAENAYVKAKKGYGKVLAEEASGS